VSLSDSHSAPHGPVRRERRTSSRVDGAPAGPCRLVVVGVLLAALPAADTAGS
jgi:hypothetical protein